MNELASCAEILAAMRKATPETVNEAQVIAYATTIGKVSCPCCVKGFMSQCEKLSLNMDQIKAAIAKGQASKNDQEKFSYELMEKMDEKRKAKR